jgi:hypothetical protein
VLEQVLQAFQECSQSTEQGWVLQFCSADTAGQATPPWAAAVTTDLVRCCTPPPQISVQPVQADQPDVLQSTGQAKVLQAALARRAVQATPPWRASVMMDLEWVLEPPAQDAVHAVQLFQLESLQSTGQPKVLQLMTTFVFSEQMLPPLAEAVTIERVLVLEPVPHVAVQAEKADHEEILQSMGQAKLLQAMVFVAAWVQVPPYMAP